MATYSINTGTVYETNFLGTLDPNLFLNILPNNTAQLIKPKEVRDATYTLWENTSFKITTATGSSTLFMGLDGNNHLDNYVAGTGSGLKILLGKPLNNNVAIVDDALLGYSGTDPSYPNSDILVYNFKADDFNGGGSDQQYTKMQFLAGTSASLFPMAPYLLSSENATGSAIDFTIYNESGQLVIDAPAGIILGSTSTPITVIQGTGSTGIDTLPGGLPGDVQLNLANCEFGYVTGASGSIGDILILGVDNTPYWGNFGADTVFTLNQVLNAGNTTDGEDIILTITDDSLYIGGTGASYARIHHDGTQNLISATAGTLRIEASTLRLEITGVNPNKYLRTDINGDAFWGTASVSSPGGSPTQIQFNDSGVFDGIGQFTWDGTSIDIGNAGTNYMLNVKTNSNGAVYVNTNGNASGFIINDGTQDILNIDSSDKRIRIDEVGVYTVNIGHAVNDLNVLSIQNRAAHDGISLFPYGANNNFNITYFSDTSGSTTASVIAFSPDSTNDGLFIGNNGSGYPLRLGRITNGITYDAAITAYGVTISNTNTISPAYAPLVFGNSEDSDTPTAGASIAADSRRSVGINVVPQVDFHLSGIEATVPQITSSLTIYGSSYKSITGFSTGYILLDGAVGGYTVNRIGLNIGNASLVPYGTTIRVWNRSGADMYILQINEYFGGTYNPTEAANIYVPTFTGSEGTLTWGDGEMFEFVYLAISTATETGGINDLVSAMATSTQIINEDGLWYLVNAPIRSIRNVV